MCTFTCTCPKNVHGGKKKSSVLLDSGARRNDDPVTKNALNDPNEPNKLNKPNQPNKPNKPNELNKPNKPNELNKPNKLNKRNKRNQRNQPAPISFDRGRYKMR